MMLLTLFLAIIIEVVRGQQSLNEWKSYNTSLSLKGHYIEYLSSLNTTILFGGVNSEGEANGQIYKYENNNWVVQALAHQYTFTKNGRPTTFLNTSTDTSVSCCFYFGGIDENNAVTKDSYVIAQDAENIFNVTKTSLDLPPLHSYAISTDSTGKYTVIYGGITTGNAKNKDVYVISWGLICRILFFFSQI